MTDTVERVAEIAANAKTNKGKPTAEERGELRAIAQDRNTGTKLKQVIAGLLGDSKSDKGAPDTSKFDAGTARALAQSSEYPILEAHRKEVGQ